MRLTWQTAEHSATKSKLSIFIATLIATALLPILSNPDIAHATDTIVQYGSTWLGGYGINIMSGGDGSHYCMPIAGAPYQSQCSGYGSSGFVWSGDKWQCVEMVNRLYLNHGWTSRTWYGNGGGSNSISNSNNLPANLTAQSNGSLSYIHTGDVVSLNNDNNDAGHAGIVDTIDANNTIHIKNQNASLDSSAYYVSGSWSAGTVTYNMNAWSGYHIRAIVHHPSSQPPPSNWPGVGSATFLNADHLNTGQTMTNGYYIVSGNVQHALIMQSDGNLVEYSGTQATWASNTGGNPGAYLGLQSDGNIVIYSSSGSPLWATSTGGQSLSYLDMQDDGNIVAYNTSGSPIWASNTDGFPVATFVGADHLNDGATLTGGNYIRSADKRYALLMQTDGSLALFGPGYHVLWSTGTGGHPGAYFGLQTDGNMVVYSSSGSPLWASNTNGQSLSYLVLQTDGNLVAVNTSGHAIWATGTNGKI